MSYAILISYGMKLQYKCIVIIYIYISYNNILVFLMIIYNDTRTFTEEIFMKFGLRKIPSETGTSTLQWRDNDRDAVSSHLRLH